MLQIIPTLFTEKVIDVHAHIYTKKFLKELASRTNYPLVNTSADGSRVIQFNEKLTHKVPDSFVDLDFRLKEMDRFGVTTQLVSATNPWTDVFPTIDLALRCSRMINEEISTIARDSKGRFLGLATLPLLSPEDAAEELVRAVDELGLCGAIIGTNVGGTHLSDPKFDLVFEAAARKRAVVFLHPTAPLGGDKLKDYGFVRSIGYTFETTTCVLKMAYAGLFEKYPSLRILTAHLGGNLPYLRGRIDTAWKKFPESKGNLSEPPTKKIRSALYADSISYDDGALRLGTEFFGMDRIMFGTDFPFEWGIKEARDSLESAIEDKEQLRAIYHENFERLLESVRH